MLCILKKKVVYCLANISSRDIFWLSAQVCCVCVCLCMSSWLIDRLKGHSTDFAHEVQFRGHKDYYTACENFEKMSSWALRLQNFNRRSEITNWRMEFERHGCLPTRKAKWEDYSSRCSSCSHIIYPKLATFALLCVWRSSLTSEINKLLKI